MWPFVTAAACAQVLVRWALQHGTSVLPKSVNEARIRSNLEVFDWQLEEQDYQALATLDLQLRMVGLGAILGGPSCGRIGHGY